MDFDLTNYEAETQVGSYFVSNYPPFSSWKPEHLPAALEVLNGPANAQPAPLGLYIHIPFCRKRCEFCYFRVYTDKNARDVDRYIDALTREIAIYADRPCFSGRKFDFVYFGGGTPSYLSSEQLKRLVDQVSEHWTWEDVREVTFECEPGTLRKKKLETIKAIGTTRLSLGVEHFDDDVLSINGRAHKSIDCVQAFGWAREVGFDHINVDLISGLVGDDESKWKDTVARTVALQPDSVTIYQMEVPRNTILARDSEHAGTPTPVADWPTKRAWLDYAFGQFEQAGYEQSSADTMARKHAETPAKAATNGRGGPGIFVYRDAVWHGADMLGTGVASFSFISGVHYQNERHWEPYVGRLERGELPLWRALASTAHQRVIRELVLQLKIGWVDAAYFRAKFDVEVIELFSDAFERLRNGGLMTIHGDEIVLTRKGLLQVDGLLPRFFEAEFRGQNHN